jgi:hypothetical protein
MTLTVYAGLVVAVLCPHQASGIHIQCLLQCCIAEMVYIYAVYAHIYVLQLDCNNCWHCTSTHHLRNNIARLNQELNAPTLYPCRTSYRDRPAHVPLTACETMKDGDVRASCPAILVRASCCVEAFFPGQGRFMSLSIQSMTMLGITARKVKIPTKKLPQPILQAVGGCNAGAILQSFQHIRHEGCRDVVSKFKF